MFPGTLLPREWMEYILNSLEAETLQEIHLERELPLGEHLLCSQTLCYVSHVLSFWIFTKTPCEAGSMILIIRVRN